MYIFIRILYHEINLSIKIADSTNKLHRQTSRELQTYIISEVKSESTIYFLF